MKKIKFTAERYSEMECERIEYRYIEDKKWRNKMFIISGCTPQCFETLFGECSFTFDGDEYILRCWSMEYNSNYLFTIISADGRGTTIELNSKEMDKDILYSFVDELFEKIKALNSEKINNTIKALKL